MSRTDLVMQDGWIKRITAPYRMMVLADNPEPPVFIELPEPPEVSGSMGWIENLQDPEVLK